MRASFPFVWKAAVVVAAVGALVWARQAPAQPPRLTTAIAEKQVQLWRCQDQLGWQRTRASVAPWALPRSTAYRRWVLNVWTQRAAVCAAAKRELARQWNWQAWLPANWYRVGSCETGYGGDPNWRHANSSYVSAFGIQRGQAAGQYDHDARKVGMPPWDDRNPPTPWQQYQTALSHYHSYGDGWGCPGP